MPLLYRILMRPTDITAGLGGAEVCQVVTP